MPRQPRTAARPHQGRTPHQRHQAMAHSLTRTSARECHNLTGRKGWAQQPTAQQLPCSFHLQLAAFTVHACQLQSHRSFCAS